MGTLSVIIPTLNCLERLPAHLESMAPWVDLASEIIVVDSHSDDGTDEYLQRHLRHPRCLFLKHPRGLYASWNFGIGRASSEWTYVSTAGDSITREQLLHLMGAGDALKAEAVLSMPSFIDNEGRSLPALDWPWLPGLITSALDLPGPAVIPSPDLYCLSLLNARYALLGSAASNLFRTRALQERPFPTDFGPFGDAAWGFIHALETRIAVTPRRGSTFRIHPKPRLGKLPSAEEMAFRLWNLALEQLDRTPASLQGDHDLTRLARLLIAYPAAWRQWHETRVRRSGRWFFSPPAWGARTRFKRLQDHLDGSIAASRAAVLSRSCRPGAAAPAGRPAGFPDSRVFRDFRPAAALAPGQIESSCLQDASAAA